MALEHIAQCAGLVIVICAMFDAYRLSYRNLDAVDVIAVPEGFKNRIGKAEYQNILNGFFAQVVVYAVNLDSLK